MLKNPHKHITRDITYSYETKSKFGEMLVRTMEAISGRMRLIRYVQGYAEEVEAGGNFWEIMYERYGLKLDIVEGSLDKIPEGPVVLVANHPYGILDGLTMGLLLSRARGQFKIIASRVFRNAPDLDEVILPIDFSGDKNALAVNIKTRKDGIDWLNNGGIIGIFPSGTVSTAISPFAEPFDPSWARFPTKLLTRTQAVVVPVYFEGSNSRLFQIASHVHFYLRIGLYLYEFRRRIFGSVRVRIGEPILRDELEPYMHDAQALKKFLRNRTYALGQVEASYGYEFEEKYRE